MSEQELKKKKPRKSKQLNEDGIVNPAPKKVIKKKKRAQQPESEIIEQIETVFESDTQNVMDQIDKLQNDLINDNYDSNKINNEANDTNNEPNPQLDLNDL